MFSDQDIRKALDDNKSNSKEGLLIAPFEMEQLTPVGYDLRVGEEAFSWNKKEVIRLKEGERIEIGAYDTVIIRTLEKIEFSKKVSATVHSIVSLIVTKGLSDISTTIDPGYSGTLLISIRNNRDSSTELEYGASLCTVCFYKVDSESVINRSTSNYRRDLWERLKDEARKEEKRISLRVKNANLARIISLICLMIGILIAGIATTLINPTVGTVISSLLAIVAPIIYDRFLKPISKL